MAGKDNNLTTLCYIEKDHRYLMLHRVAKKKDVNKDKWIGVGGHAKDGESPEDCLLREVKEETGYTLTSFEFRGLVTFITDTGITEYMCLYTADGFTGEEISCDEGTLEWVDKEKVLGLNIWEGDKIFFRLIEENRPFFSLKLRYRGDVLTEAVLDGIPMELFEERRANGEVTGVVMERSVAHRDGRAHGTAHIWIIRKNEEGSYEVLLQKRSASKDSNPGSYDISSAGHLLAGDTYLEGAVRELKEELGVEARAEELTLIGMQDASFEGVFYGKVFRDHEISSVYVYEKPVNISDLSLQPDEVESVRWMELETCVREVESHNITSCIRMEELDMLKAYLREKRNF